VLSVNNKLLKKYVVSFSYSNFTIARSISEVAWNRTHIMNIFA